MFQDTEYLIRYMGQSGPRDQSCNTILVLDFCYRLTNV